MKLRQAKKIMKNIRLYSGMIWVYGSGRVLHVVGCAGITPK